MQFNNQCFAPLLSLRILSFDGGGTRGVLSIAMLKEIMLRISPNEKVQPYELFDIICGTSTGGIIAVLLGAQRRSVVETETLYDDFIDKVRQRGEYDLLLFYCVWSVHNEHKGGKGIFPRLPIGPHTYLHLALYFIYEMIILNVLKSSNVVRLSSFILKRF